MIEEVVEPLVVGARGRDPLQMASLKRLFRPDEDPNAPQAVKVVTDLDDNALYFSRSLVPFPRNPTPSGPFLHVGIYAYRRDFLLEFNSWPIAPLEQIEGLEQLRVLEHGHRIKVPTTEHFSIGVDTPEDLVRVRQILEK
jgi:3-deoxy-manno-octulosonate cytidylyltransferase (CMP-KDO synthetase)